VLLNVVCFFQLETSLALAGLPAEDPKDKIEEL
jgi:hypothetical protein